MARIIGQGRVQDTFDFRAGLQPLGDFQAAFMMLAQAHAKGAKPALCQIAIIGTNRIARYDDLFLIVRRSSSVAVVIVPSMTSE